MLGYREIQLHPPAFENDLQFDEALDLIPRLQSCRRASTAEASRVKFTNTLVVKNHKQVFSDELMYMSGAPLHVLAMNLVQKFRARMREPIPISFSGGLDAHNVAAAVAMNFVPVTTCTDLLRPGGYARLIRYLDNLGAEMRRVGASQHCGICAAVSGPGRRRAHGRPAQHADPGGRSHRQSALRVGTQPGRAAQDRRRSSGCTTASTATSACRSAPTTPTSPTKRVRKLSSTTTSNCCPAQSAAIPGGVLRVVKAHQLANYADACNECGNCDMFCPEEGGPQVEKPRFFGSLETYRSDAGANGFYIDWAACTIHGTLGRERYELVIDTAVDLAWFRPQRTPKSRFVRATTKC